MVVCFFFQAEDGIRDLVRSRGLGDVYKRQALKSLQNQQQDQGQDAGNLRGIGQARDEGVHIVDCLLYTSDAADERSSVDLGGRRIINKTTQVIQRREQTIQQHRAKST